MGEGGEWEAGTADSGWWGAMGERARGEGLQERWGGDEEGGRVWGELWCKGNAHMQEWKHKENMKAKSESIACNNNEV